MIISGMKDFLHLRTLALVVAVLVVAVPQAGAQGYFGFSVSPSTTSMLVNNLLTYTINVTNQTGFKLATAFVTNLLPSSVQFQSASPTGYYSVNGSVVVFDLGAYFGHSFFTNQSVVMTLTVQPTATGSITNMVTVSSLDVTNTASTNVVVLVTNAVTLADLGVVLTGLAQPVITNDWMAFGVSVTNAGPNTAPNVMLTNTLPPGVGFKSVSPASPAPSIVGSNVIFNLGTMASGAFTSFLLTVQPTNAGVLLFSSSVGSASVPDPNPANNFASTNITVTGYLTSTLVAVTNSAQTVNLQNGLEEQSILLTNAGGIDVPAARVVVTGLTKQLFNAVGTNNGSPFVDYSAGLAAGQSVTLLLQYAPRGSFTFTNGQLHAFALPAVPDWTPPAATSFSTNINITRIVRLSNGNMLIEWPAIMNRTYTVVYSDNVLFSNATIAPPAVVAPANEVQWIDYGPPTTVSQPTNSTVRFYRVFLNP
jgi:uncharacterized repeat protein (TIGR01451 family)